MMEKIFNFLGVFQSTSTTLQLLLHAARGSEDVIVKP